MTHRYALRAATTSVALSLLFALGCGGSSSGSTVTQAAAGPPTALQMLPADSPMLVHANVSSILGAPYFGVIRDALSQFADEGGDESDLSGYLAVADQTETFAMSAKPLPNEGGAVLFVMRGTYTEQSLAPFLGRGSSESLREHTMHRAGIDLVSVLLGDDTILVGSPSSVRDAIDRYDGLAPVTGPQLNGYAEAAGRAHIGQSDFSAVYLFTDEIRELIRGEDAEAMLAENALSMGASLDMQEGLAVSAFVMTNSASAATEVGDFVRGLLRELGDDTGLAMLGVGAIINMIEVEENGNDVSISLRLDDSEFRSALDMLRPILSLIGAS